MALARQPKPSKRFLQIIGAASIAGIAAAMDKIERKGEYISWNHGNTQISGTCCGIRELTDIDDASDIDLVNLICTEHEDIEQFNCFVYYSINRPLERRLKTLGFKEIARFKNPNSGNEVHMLCLTF